jgi:hypothetical protein
MLGGELETNSNLFFMIGGHSCANATFISD